MNSRSVDDILEFDWVDEDPGAETLTFARLLVAGTLEAIEQVDDEIRLQLEHWDFERVARVDRAVLRLGAYSLLHRREIPSKVTIDESVSIAKEFGSPDSYRFVNGVLDGIRKRLSL